MPKKRLDAKLLVSALVISGLLFGSGMIIGYMINREKLTSIESEMNSVVQDVQNFQLQFLFIDVLGENSSCPLLSATLANINRRSYDIGRYLESYSSQSEIQDYESYLRTRQEYSRLLVNYWLLANKLKKSCEMDAETVLYFYSSECSMCEDQAFVLTYLKNKYGDNLLIFALDAELDEPSTKTIVGFYNITAFPSIVVGENLHEGFQSTEMIENEIASSRE